MLNVIGHFCFEDSVKLQNSMQLWSILFDKNRFPTCRLQTLGELVRNTFSTQFDGLSISSFVFKWSSVRFFRLWILSRSREHWPSKTHGDYHRRPAGSSLCSRRSLFTGGLEWIKSEISWALGDISVGLAVARVLPGSIFHELKAENHAFWTLRQIVVNRNWP